MSQHVATIVTGQHPDPDVRVYLIDKLHSEEEDIFYWCCEKCGACSRYHQNIYAATTGGLAHAEVHKEDSNG